MNEHAAPVNTWHQLSMSAEEIIEITLKIGLMPLSDHCQFEVSAENPVTHDLLMLESRPHVKFEQLEAELARVFARAAEVVAYYSDPFRPL
jgi:hypothetical protein